MSEEFPEDAKFESKESDKRSTSLTKGGRKGCKGDHHHRVIFLLHFKAVNHSKSILFRFKENFFMFLAEKNMRCLPRLKIF